MRVNELNPLVQRLLELLLKINGKERGRNDQLNVKQKGGFCFPAGGDLLAGNRETGELNYAGGMS